MDSRTGGRPTDDPTPAGLWTQKEAASYLRVSARWLRDSGAPKTLLPGNGPQGKPVVRYRREDVDEWLESHRTTRRY